MLKRLDYYQMRSYFYHREVDNSVEFKLNELENLWYCTQKSVKRRLKQLGADGSFMYHPGIGRGNPSIISYSKSFQVELEEDVDKLLSQDQFEDVIQILQLPIPKTIATSALARFQSLFGLQPSNESKDILRTIFTRKITTLDPLYTAINFESFLIHQLGDTLVTYNHKADLVEPHLAHNWEIDSKNNVWTFYIRKNIRFHNHQLLTSEDVKYTFQRLQAHSSSYSWLVEEIENIECPSPYIVQFVLKKSNPFFLRFLCSPNLVILSKDEPFDEYKWNGSGPFQMKRRTDNLLVLESFTDYFLASPLIDEIHFYRVPLKPNTSITYEIERKEGKELPLHKLNTEIGFRYLAFNFKRETIVNHPSFRKAIFHLFDVKKMWNELGRTNLKEASSFFYWNSKALEKKVDLVPSLLQESGYNGEILALYTVENPGFIEKAEWFKKEALEVGIQFKIVTFKLEQIYDSFIEEADLLFMGEVASNDHHLSFMSAFLNQSSILNLFLTQSHMNHLQLYFNQMKHELDKEHRNEIIGQIEDYIQEENLFLYLYHPVKKRIFHSVIHDIEFESYGYVDFRKLWIK